MTRDHVFRVALGAPVMRLFDYLPPAEPEIPPRPGQRVLVPFGPKTRAGVLVSLQGSSDLPASRLRRVIRILDEEPLLDPQLMALLEWASAYYHHPPGEVINTALPAALRRGGGLVRRETRWRLTSAGRDVDVAALTRRAPVQARILETAKTQDTAVGRTELSPTGRSWRASVVALESKGWLEAGESGIGAPAPLAGPPEPGPVLTPAQREAVESINGVDAFGAFLLQGVTGSGKTEVYLRCIERWLAEECQSLVLVPEIGLTPQLVDRFRRRLRVSIVVMHSGLSDGERLRAWSAAREGSAAVIIGTRSAIFTPLARPGLIIIDEEHDSSFKQQEGFRYSARDLAVWRARQLAVPIILGSATPSFESLENVAADRYRRLVLPQRPGAARQPDIHLIDLRRYPPQDGLSEPLVMAIRRHLDAEGQVLLYLNRRGFAPSLLCTGCGYTAECRRCDARLVVHRGRDRLICHHCGAERTIPETCPDCGSPMQPVGRGTQRLEQSLQALLPEQPIVRIDRDTTRRRGEIERRLDQVRSGEARLLLGTQMLTKGHDFPQVTLVGIVDADQGLFGTDFRSSERLAQTFVQVAGRAGRADRPGEVYIQTLFPDHPLLSILVTEGYDRFSAQAMKERQQAGWPPYAYLSLLRAAAVRREPVYEFLQRARDLGQPMAGRAVRLLGPAPAPMERRSGRYRGQLLVHSENRRAIQSFLASWRPGLDGLKSGRRARWSLDVDPIELF